MAQFNLKKGPLARWSAAGRVFYPTVLLLAFGTVISDYWSTRDSDSGDDDVESMSLNSVDDIADVAVFNYRGIGVLHVILRQVVRHPPPRSARDGYNK